MPCFSLFLPAGRARRLAAALLGAACLGSAGAAEYASTVIASGLNNPRGLSFGLDGALWIAEAGLTGGMGPSVIVRGDPQVLGDSGSVTRWFAGTQERVYTGLASIYNANNGDVNGPNDIVFGADGAARVAIGAGFDPTLRSSLGPGGAALGRLLTPGGTSVDVSAHELANNPAGGPLDSNPWHLARIDGATLVTDAGANALLRVGDDGIITTVASFAARSIGGPFPTESVPTGLAVGDGAYYVGELSGFPFIPGASRIHKVLADGTSAVFATGFTQISDMAFGADGSLYVLELDSNGLLNPGNGGSLWRLEADGSRSLVFNDGLIRPTGLEIGADGAFYISVSGSGNGQGEVLRVAAIPEPETYALLLAGLAAMAAIRRRRS